MTTALWTSDDTRAWSDALAGYSRAISARGGARLEALDMWYSRELPPLIAARALPHITHDELVRVTEWKMARGVWRAPNLVLVRSNAAELVMTTSANALAQVPHPRQPVATLSTLAGVGAATASAVLAAAHPAIYPFFDELVAAQVPALGPVAWTLPYYLKYAEALRERAAALGGWTAGDVERAIWSLELRAQS